MLRPLTFAAALSLGASAAVAQDAPTADALFDALGMPEIIRIMALEGESYGDTLAEGMFPGRSDSAEWDQTVSVIYDPERMEQEVRAAFAEELEGADIAPMYDFFASDLGEKIVSLEVSAREAMLDPSVEEASGDVAARAVEEGGPRIEQIDAFIEVNDLIERNVVGGMNSNYAFYLGLSDGGGLQVPMSPDELLRDVWMQEPQIRQDTTEWLYSFLLLAYQPLSDAELDAYIAFSETEAGQDLIRASFTAYNGMFDDISHGMGLAASRYVGGQEL